MTRATTAFLGLLLGVLAGISGLHAQTATGTLTPPVVRTLNHQQNLAAVTMNSTDATLFTYTLPANTLGAGGCIHVSWQIKHTTGTTVTAYKLWFGATSASFGSSADVTTWQQAIPVQICNDSGSTAAQTWQLPPFIFSASATLSFWAATSPQTSAIDTTADVIIKITANNVTGTDQVTPVFWVVR